MSPELLPWDRARAGSTDPAARARKKVESGEGLVRLGGHTPGGCAGGCRYAAGPQSLHGALEDRDLLASRQDRDQGQVGGVVSKVPAFGWRFKSQAMGTQGSGLIRIQRFWQETGLRAGLKVRSLQHPELDVAAWGLA